ncbi:sensor histidine kinase [Longitalea luteola]|uniref:sensor histidine kinase n=1 Tax=Longitalea luteola TaxID=2812563 RepID=UPI001A963E21|nr:HAMP domain-containing sensor histidine kinase [Longitalea luteola]
MGSKFAYGSLSDNMRSSTLRWLVLLASILIMLIITVQLFWLNKVYSFEQKTFNTNVVKSIRGLYEDLNLVNSRAHLQDLIEHPSIDYFLMRVDNFHSKDSIAYHLQHELNEFDVLTDAYIAYYDAGHTRYKDTSYITAAASRYPPSTINLSVYNRPFSYILLYFPHRNKYVLQQMNFWFISSAIVFLVLIGLAMILFFFYRQRFLAEIQKDFVNNFTHEFKTPLAVMKISAEVLLQEKITAQPDRLRKYATIIANQTQHLQDQVERLLQIARSDRKDLTIEKKQVPLKDLIEQAVAKMQPLIDEKKAEVKIQVDEEQYNMELSADRAHLELAIVNLLENALKFSAKPYIIVSIGQEEGNIYISVKDNGIGIDKKYQKRLFNKFYRVPTGDVHNVKGFGLGLNFVKRIIDAHHGTIKINSLPGIGTEFRLILPATVNS